MIAIVGGGLSGLSCARELAACKIPFRLFEATKKLGGRVATDHVNGFLIDRGFQVLLDSYPSVRPYVKSLRPQFFDSGALLADEGKFWKILNPIKHPLSAPASALSSALPLRDKFAFSRLVTAACLSADDDQIRRASSPRDQSIVDCLRKAGISPVAIERFFRPFFGGVFLDDSLESSAALLRYYLKKFSLGRAFVPEGGAGSFPALLAAELPPESIQLDCRVEGWEIQGNRVSAIRLPGGSLFEVSHVVLAMSPTELASFLGIAPPATTQVATLALAGEESLYPDRLIVLPAGRKRIVRHFVQITNISPSYAPAGRHLVVATLLRSIESTATIRAARSELEKIFPASAKLELVDYRITHHATLLSRPGNLIPHIAKNLPENVTIAGDTAGWSCVEPVLRAGQLAAEKVALGAAGFEPTTKRL